jgi:hypothetical protein
MKDRIKYYLLDWKDHNMNKFIDLFGEVGLHELDNQQKKQLLSIAIASDGVLADVSESEIARMTLRRLYMYSECMAIDRDDLKRIINGYCDKNHIERILDHSR